MLGNHDTPPIWQLVRTWEATGGLTAQAAYLARRLAPQPSAVAALHQEFLRSPEHVALAKFADLFVSRARQVVVFFTDFFGFTEDYNVPGTVHADNWSLRLPADFERLYHERVARELPLTSQRHSRSPWRHAALQQTRPVPVSRRRSVRSPLQWAPSRPSCRQNERS